ncbi:unnamed protein product [Polarella glacialis]|uniref:Uncharacterized protein n=1 Tax=Polarella glacialis TaxID=89957 RepID=A0A813LUJ3_POLGL|nr:unnamed protein product [Polarella glacialis]
MVDVVCAPLGWRTRSQACRARRKLRIFAAGLCRGMKIGDGAPGLERHSTRAEFDAIRDLPVQAPDLRIAPSPLQLDMAAPAGNCENLEVVSLTGNWKPLTSVSDNEAVMEDIFRFIVATRTQHMQQTCSSASCRDMAGIFYALKPYVPKHAQEVKQQIPSDYSAELSIPGLPFSTTADAVQLLAVSTRHADFLLDWEYAEDTRQAQLDLQRHRANPPVMHSLPDPGLGLKALKALATKTGMKKAMKKIAKKT